MNVELLRTFRTVAQAGSLSEAARRLNVSKSTVSGRLAELEQVLRRQLFYRSPRKLSLTQEGAAVYEVAERILQEVDGLLSHNSSPTLRGKLRIAAPSAFGRRHLSSAVIAFLNAHPDLDATVDLEDRVTDLIGEGYDLAIRVGQLADSRLVARRLAESRRVLVAAESYLQRRGIPRSVADLSSHDAVMYSGRRGPQDWSFEDGASPLVARPQIRIRSNNPDFLLQATLDGSGLSVMPTFMASQGIAQGRLRVLDVGGRLRTEGIYAVYPSRAHPPPAVRALVQHLASTFGEPPYWDRQMAAA